MTSTSVSSDAPATPRPSGHRRRRRTRRVVLLALLLLVLAGLGFAWWLGTGLLDASRTVQNKAADAQSELQQFRDTLKDGDKATAAAHLRTGRADLAAAAVAADRRQVRLAAHLPWVGETVSDLDHLLAAADIMTRSGGDALKVYEDFSGSDSKLFRAGKFSLPAITRAQHSVAAIGTSMDRAETELRAVHGKGPKGAEALAKKRSALAQITSLRQEIVSLSPLLDALPSAVGAQGRKTYLVAIMNPAEMRASGGAPLSVALVRFRHGTMSIPLQGTTSELTDQNQKTEWTPLPDDPWQDGVTRQRFVNANFNPSFPVSAEEMARAVPSNFGAKVDGVVALDIVAISDLLRVTGPIESQDYGTLTADNVATKLLINGYKTQGADASARHDANDQLMSIMLSRLTEGGGLIGKAKALGQAVPARHLQMYFRDDRLQQLVEDKSMAGAVPQNDVGNLSAVFTQNGNASKMDVFQNRTVSEVVHIRADGSALVRRTVKLTNDSPPYIAGGVDHGGGYDTRWSGQLVISMMPAGAELKSSPEATVRHPSIHASEPQVYAVDDGVDQAGRPYGQATVYLPPRSTGSLTWSYVVPKATTRHGSALRLLDYLAPQPMLRTPNLHLKVVAPKGWSVQPADGWDVSGASATRTTPMDRPAVLKIQVAPAG